MEQNGRGKKPFKKKNHYPKKKPSAFSEKDTVSPSRPKDPVKATDDYGVSREMMESSFGKKKRSADYSGSYSLIESFEAEEKGTSKKSARRNNFSKTEKNSYNVKGKNESFQKKKDFEDGKSLEDNNSLDKGESKKRAFDSKNENSKGKKKGSFSNKRDPHSSETDGSIKTKYNREYIPVDFTDDDIIPEDAFSFGDSVTSREGGKTARAVRAEAALPGAVVGRNAVRELLRSDRSVDKLYVKSGNREGSIVVIVAEAVSRKIPITEVSQDKLDELSGGANHQGVVALAAEKQYTDIDSILKIAKERGETPFVVIADGIEDPQNLGALIRCAECAGVHGIIIPKRRAVGLTPAVTKASAGAIEHMAIAKVSNLADAIEKLKKAGLWIFAAEAGGVPYYEANFKGPVAVVLGSEGFGVGKLIKEKSDFTVSIPMYGHVNSLNVATAASVILCHAARVNRG